MGRKMDPVFEVKKEIPARAAVPVSQPAKGTQMFSKTVAVGHAVLTVVLGSAALLSQQTPGASSSSAGHNVNVQQLHFEFPVIMRQNVAAGTTPVGTKVQAKLVIATLVDGVVVPQGAILSGEVTESVARSATHPSRLAIRMDYAQWKNGSAPIVLWLTKKAYLTAWIYPVVTMVPQDAPYDPPIQKLSLVSRHSRPGSNNPTLQPFPDSDTDKDTSLVPPPPSGSPQHSVLMKDVESTGNSGGAVTLTSKRFNIKLDKQTTYVLAAGGLAGGPG